MFLRFLALFMLLYIVMPFTPANAQSIGRICQALCPEGYKQQIVQGGTICYKPYGKDEEKDAGSYTASGRCGPVQCSAGCTQGNAIAAQVGYNFCPACVFDPTGGCTGNTVFDPVTSSCKATCDVSALRARCPQGFSETTCDCLEVKSPTAASTSQTASRYCPQDKMAIRYKLNDAPTCVTLADFDNYRKSLGSKLQSQGMTYTEMLEKSQLLAQSPFEYDAAAARIRNPTDTRGGKSADTSPASAPADTPASVPAAPEPAPETPVPPVTENPTANPDSGTMPACNGCAPGYKKDPQEFCTCRPLKSCSSYRCDTNATPKEVRRGNYILCECEINPDSSAATQ